MFQTKGTKGGERPGEGAPPHRGVTTGLTSLLLSIPPHQFLGLFFLLSSATLRGSVGGSVCVCVNVCVCVCAVRWKFHKNVFYTYKLARMGEYALE